MAQTPQLATDLTVMDSGLALDFQLPDPPDEEISDAEFQQQGSNLMIAIPNAPKAKITEVNYFHKNGYLHMVNAFLMPNE